MRLRTVALGLALAALVSALPALANDSSAELAAGGLVLTRNDAIRMASEDLYISQDEVRVNYVFRNTAATAQTVRVAFPMPDIVIEEEGESSIPTEDPVNFLGFVTTVDGRPVQTTAEQRVFKNGVDQTALLRRLGVPLAPQHDATAAAIARLPAAARAELERLEMFEAYPYDEAGGTRTHYSPRWTLKTTFHWQQVFPAGRDIRISHRYRPAVGGSAGTMVGSANFRQSDDFRPMTERYCIDAPFLTAVERRRAPGEDWVPLMEARIEYVLTTGANWLGPIGDFRMVIDKGSPDSLVSFCGEGIRKISPTQFEVRRRNFTPTRDVSVLILRRPPE